MTGKAEHIRDLRGIADGGWKTLAFMFGRPDAIIRKGFISLAEHREISNWLRHFEHFVRRLLLVLALAIDLTRVDSVDQLLRAEGLSPEQGFQMFNDLKGK